jgi:hypothetical protein
VGVGGGIGDWGLGIGATVLSRSVRRLPLSTAEGGKKHGDTEDTERRKGKGQAAIGLDKAFLPPF